MSTPRSPVLTVGVDLVFHTILVFSVYLLFAGHNQPGGGFVGGLLAGAALVLRYASGGSAEVERLARVEPQTLFGVGLLLSAGTGLVPALLGDAFLQSTTWTWEVPVLGTVKASSTLFFDIGVYLVVVGLVLMVLEVLGGEGDGAPTAADEGGRP